MRNKIIILIFLSIVFSNEKNKKQTNPIFTMGLSAVIPGGGQFLNGDWRKGLVFLGVELISFNQKNKYHSSADKYIELYEEYANDYWTVDKWLRDFYLFKNPDSDVYPAFVNSGNDGEYCDTSDPNNHVYCNDDEYKDIWNYSHGVNFTHNNNFYSFDNIAYFYENVCSYQMNNGGSCPLFAPVDSDNDGDPDDSNNDGIPDDYHIVPWGYLETDSNGNFEVDDNGNVIPVFGNIEAVRDHHFHEGLGKYPEFFSGWEDATLDESRLEIRNGYEIPLTDKKEEFQMLRNKSNSKFDKEEIYLSLIFVNHAVSMFDAFLTSVNRMKKIDVNSRLKYGDNFNISGIELSVNW